MSDYLKSNPHIAELFATLTRELGETLPDDPVTFLAKRLKEIKLPESHIEPDSPREFYPLELKQKALTIVILGASGDLAKKKTYPALFELYSHGLLPNHAQIIGYARSDIPQDKFLEQISSYFKEHMLKEKFLRKCSYISGKYDNMSDFQRLGTELKNLEGGGDANRMFYLALPPSVFLVVSEAIKLHLMSPGGWNRLIVEKPFGKDLDSASSLANSLSLLFTENQIYRIDHYLGKEMVQNMLSLRFSNKVFSNVWNNHSISNVQITFKEPFGTDGRGGYFDQFGIIRDIIQNHLLQILTLIAMEKPKDLSADAVRDEKVRVLRCVRPLQLDHCVLGQYVKAPDGTGEAYLDDPTVPKGSITPTMATVVLYLDNDRWEGVPFIMKAGKATNERKAEVRIQFKNEIQPFGDAAHRNELVLRVQPKEAVYLKVNTKIPGLSGITELVQTELDLSYHSRFGSLALPEAYESLLYDVLCGQQGNFVRTDELLEAWKVFTPLLNEIEQRHVVPIPYAYGSRGPKESDELMARVGFKPNLDYKWQPPVLRS